MNDAQQQPEEPMRITIDLKRTEYDRLSEIAKAERRPLRDQAAWFVSEALQASQSMEQRLIALEESIRQLREGRDGE